MGAKSLVMLKTHLGSIINIRFVNDFVYGNMSWAFGSFRVFLCNYVLYLFGLIFRYILRFLLGGAKNELHVPLTQDDSEVNGFSDELANFLFWSGEDVHQGSEERDEETESSAFMEIESDLHECNEKREGEIDSSAFMDTVSDVHEDSEKKDGETECSVLMETHSDIHKDREKIEVHTEDSVLKEVVSDVQEHSVERVTEEDESAFMESDSANAVIHSKDSGREAEGYVFIESDSEVHKDRTTLDKDETEISAFMNNGSDVHENDKKLDENEIETSPFIDNESNFGDENKEREEEAEEETEGPVFVESDSVTTTSKCEYMSGKSIISGFIEEPTAMRFSFREFYMGPDVSAVSYNACANTAIIADNEFSESELHEKEDSVDETVSISSNDIPFHFESGAFGGTDSSDEDDVLFNEHSLESDSESESSSSSGLIWGNSNTFDDSLPYQFMVGKNSGEGFQSEILKLMMRDERSEDVEERQFSCEGKVSGFRVQSNYAGDGYIEMEPGMKNFKSLNHGHGFGGVDFAKAVDIDKKEDASREGEACRKGQEKTEETRWEEELTELESDEQDDDDLEWEHDDLVEQLKMELKHARQGGLATILEEEEREEQEEEEEHKQEREHVAESPKVVEDLKPLKIEEKLEYRDQIDEIEKVYKSYAEKMRKLDILNYQTMHALGLVQLKDPLKLISIPKSTIPVAKPVIPQNLWPRKASKSTSDPLLRLVNELHRDLELVYVGQVCLSWEILCWQQKKAQELQQYDSQYCRRYNLVAGEFQLFQVLMQRFIENEPFQGPRVQNYVKNRCVIRNLLQVPAIKDDSMKDKNTTKGGQEDAIASGRLADIIKESMRVFWEFVRADKDYGNVILKVSQQIGTDLKDPAISGLLVDIRTQLHKKEKRLKDIVRTGNCIVKKFQKHHEDQLDHDQLVAQVGLRLISRVLNMSKLGKEQLIWCNEKLHRIKILNRKIVQVEPSLFLFPC